jgi:hypothetical protein
MKETGLDYADTYAKVKHELGAESREKKSTATLGHDAQLADWRAQMTQGIDRARAAARKARPLKNYFYVRSTDPREFSLALSPWAPTWGCGRWRR